MVSIRLSEMPCSRRLLPCDNPVSISPTQNLKQINAMTNEREQKDRDEQLQEWLADNVLVVPEPREVTLHHFIVDWADWSGEFRVTFDNLVFKEPLTFGAGANGYVGFSLPPFTSPLGVPASFARLKITEKTSQAIQTALRSMFPRLKPLGRNRETGIEITYSSPLEARISAEDVSATKKRVHRGCSISVKV